MLPPPLRSARANGQRRGMSMCRCFRATRAVHAWDMARALCLTDDLAELGCERKALHRVASMSRKQQARLQLHDSCEAASCGRQADSPKACPAKPRPFVSQQITTLAFHAIHTERHARWLQPREHDSPQAEETRRGGDPPPTMSHAGGYRESSCPPTCCRLAIEISARCGS